ncbi:MAG: hypothetical protein QOG80_2528, partial [Pseudonocardiales bacterium]|nr:hypothetical protein [Pseudonocardiales bacterium]
MPDELNRWLRRVRPPTAADDDWAASEDGQRALTDIHRRSTRSGAARRMRVWTVLPAASLAAVAVAVLVVALVSNPRPAPTAPHALPRLTTTRPVAKFLTPFTSCATLLAGLRTHAQAHVASFGYGGYAYGQPMHGGPVLGPLVNSSAAGTTDTNLNAQTSTTNVQEIGVDEPDIVKTDGDRVVTVTDGRLRVIDAAKHVVTGTLDLSLYANAQSAQLLVSGDTAVVILRPGGYVSPGYAGPMISSLGPIPGGQGLRSTVLYVELSGAPTVSGSMLVDGDVVDARMVGSTVRLVVSSAPKITPPTPSASDTQNKARTRAALGKAPLSAWLPSYTLNTSSGATTHAVPCAQVSHPTDYTAASMLTIYTLDPTTPDADPQPVSLTADGDTVYATATSLYVASNPACGWCYGAAGTQPTQIHRFDITGAGKPTYLGSGSVPGSLLSQYSISDYAGSLRVATTIDAAGGIPTGA